MFSDLITSKTRVKVLKLFLAHAHEMFHVREIVRRVDEEINAVRRELLYLEKKKVLKKEPRANRVYYMIDPNYTFYNEMIEINAKLEGLGGDLIKNKVKLGKIKFAMLSGKYVLGIRDNPEEIDLLVVGTVVLPELSLVIKKAEGENEIEINYTVMSEEEFVFRKKRRDPFISSIIHGPRLMLIGDEIGLLS